MDRVSKRALLRRSSDNKRVPLPLACARSSDTWPRSGMVAQQYCCLGRMGAGNGRVVGPRRHPKNVMSNRWDGGVS